MDTRYEIYVGNFGSGKSELAINAAVNAVRRGVRTVLCDIDIVNPYFRSSTMRKRLYRAGVAVISAGIGGRSTEVPSLPAEVARIFSGEFGLCVIDVGGDSIGARALGRYREAFARAGDRLRCHLVVNALRPMTGTPEEIVEMCGQIEAASRLRVTDLINNTNLAEETTPEIIAAGLHTVQVAARLLGKKLLDEQTPPEIYLRPRWLSETK